MLKNKRVKVSFGWYWGGSIFLVPTIDIAVDFKCISIVWLKWSLNFSYLQVIITNGYNLKGFMGEKLNK